MLDTKNKKSAPSGAIFYFWWLWSECNSHDINVAGPFHFASLRPEPSVRFREPQTETKNHPQGMVFYFWWLWSESNRHSFRNLILSQARLPVPPQSQNSSQPFILLSLRLLFLRTLSLHQPF